MKIRLAKTAGFCFGVDRAVKMVEELSNIHHNVKTLGPIIHNKQVVLNLQKKGVEIIDDIKKFEKEDIVVIRSHGVSLDIYKYLEDNKIEYNDATCPYVKKIHKIVYKESNKGKLVIIAGNKDHPEIKGIVGHCKTKAYIFEIIDDLVDIINKNIYSFNINGCIMISQTTFDITLWEQCVKMAKKVYTNIEIFDTICSATDERQSEAVEISQNSDLVIIIGGNHSSNTAKLKEVCSRYSKTIHIETREDLDLSLLDGYDNIGVTAGASTPSYIIEEVLKTMSDKLNIHEDEMSFADLLEQSMDEKLYIGKKVKGTVISIFPNEVQVDVGGKQSGFIPMHELSDDPNLKPEDILQKGCEVEVIVIKVNDQEGIVTLSKKRCNLEKNFEAICTAYENEEVLDAIIVNVVRGGVLALVKDIKIFIPASQVSDRRIEDLNTLLKKEVKVKIIEVKKQKNRAVGSVRILLQEERLKNQEKIWETIEEGNEYTGFVKSITSYGCFVDIGGVDGMVHITDLSWKKIKHPSEIVKTDDIIKVYIKSLNRETKKISLGYKKDEDNPWIMFKETCSMDHPVDVKIVSITTFGAFAEIIPGIDGLIHISEIDNKKIEKIEDVLKVGQHLKVKIIDVDFDKKRIGLSIKELLNIDNSHSEIISD